MDADGNKQAEPLCFEENKEGNAAKDLLEKVLDKRIDEVEKEGHCEVRSMSFRSGDQDARIRAKAMAVAGANQIREEEVEGATPEKVVSTFNSFLYQYDLFREKNGLSGSVDNVYEALTAMSDKHGRICRQVKHFERDDAKSDWPEALTESLVGYLIYSLMILKKYDLDITDGMTQELQNAVEQHGEK